ncbi:unnamed protein product [Notodromas monacha]|uniref:cyclic pyranopterin monophosphate synthase n=1 Tax=Notodromas monacha TaxID=399045 RepID=A0A7R9BGG6_9CRUS|nr:unnamed protein product [Notodromas monacha]CAG0913965.1 unnamed protein product [Notodromas monacha]
MQFGMNDLPKDVNYRDRDGGSLSPSTDQIMESTGSGRNPDSSSMPESEAHNASFSTRTQRTRRNYRRRHRSYSSSSSSSSSEASGRSASAANEQEPGLENSPSSLENESSQDSVVLWSSSSSSSPADLVNLAGTRHLFEEEDLSASHQSTPMLRSSTVEPKPAFLSKKPLQENFLIHKEFYDRQIGGCGKSCAGFVSRYTSSLTSIQRMKRLHKLEFHKGCVNAVAFNSTGVMLASGSDDLKVGLWDWARKKLLCSFKSGHTSNILDIKYMHLIGDSHLVSCARDGQVRLSDLSAVGISKNTRRLIEHRSSAEKLALDVDHPHVVMSISNDGFVTQSDIREEKPVKLLRVRDENDSAVSMHCICINPVLTNEYCVCGGDAIVRIYDRRNAKLMKCYSPSHMQDKLRRKQITSAVYSHDGREIVANYQYEDVYLFNTEGGQFTNGSVRQYEGRSNINSVKGVSFYGPNSEYVISGSDCGHLYIWDKDSEALVQCLRGDEAELVNVTVPHPFFPIIASCGVDDDVKIWIPGPKSTVGEKFEENVEKNSPNDFPPDSDSSSEVHESDSDEDTSSCRSTGTFSHVDTSGKVRMVDVSDKKKTSRSATATGTVILSKPAFDLLSKNAVDKGDVLTVAKIAGIQGAKRTSELIPLCHQLSLSRVRVDLTLEHESNAVRIEATASASDVTGVEMEALTAVSVAALTVYDMCKAVDKGILISNIRLMSKAGGKSGDWKRD